MESREIVGCKRKMHLLLFATISNARIKLYNIQKKSVFLKNELQLSQPQIVESHFHSVGHTQKTK